jgi:DNA-binding NarL/FixJ family response regulator
VNLPGCTALESKILRLRAQGKTFRQIAKTTGVSPRKLHDHYLEGLKRLVHYGEQAVFLQETKTQTRRSRVQLPGVQVPP